MGLFDEGFIREGDLPVVSMLCFIARWCDCVDSCLNEVRNL